MFNPLKPAALLLIIPLYFVGVAISRTLIAMGNAVGEATGYTTYKVFSWNGIPS